MKVYNHRYQELKMAQWERKYVRFTGPQMAFMKAQARREDRRNEKAIIEEEIAMIDQEGGLDNAELAEYFDYEYNNDGGDWLDHIWEDDWDR